MNSQVISFSHSIIQSYNHQMNYDFTNLTSISASFCKDGAEELSSGYSSDYGLFQNYPNPFNPTTIITYQMSADNFVTLKVFDIMGREVAELENTHKSAGTHSVEFNASELSSGIYLYRIPIGKYSETRKLILQR